MGTLMQTRTFDFCALQFLNQWIEREKGFSESLVSGFPDMQKKALAKSAGHFRVARNFPLKNGDKQNIDRYKPVLEILNEIEEITSDNVVSVVQQSQQKISRQYGGRRVLSATTKFLWLKFKYPVRIYDSQARKALGTSEWDFSSFNIEFLKCFDKYESEIRRACSNLKSVISYTSDPNMDLSAVNSLVSERWFMERVLDTYLWNKGG